MAEPGEPLVRAIARIFARWFRASFEARRDATVLLTMYDPPHAWLEARERRSRTADAPGFKHWNAVMREIELRTGYRHQPDTATRYLDSRG